METIQSIASESRFEESNPEGNFETHKIYKTLQDVQPKLIELYTGEYKHFSDLTCPNCHGLAIEPKDCLNCGEQICKLCFNGITTKGDSRKRECGSCSQPFSNDFKNAGKAVQGMLRNATFSCIFDCGKMYIPLNKIEEHLEECRERIIKCPKAEC